MINCNWIKTTKEIYRAIYKEHINDLQVFGTCTLPDGDFRLGIPNPYIYTEWGFKGATKPIIRSIATKKHIGQKEYDYEYFIAYIFASNED